MTILAESATATAMATRQRPPWQRHRFCFEYDSAAAHSRRSATRSGEPAFPRMPRPPGQRSCSQPATTARLAPRAATGMPRLAGGQLLARRMPYRRGACGPAVGLDCPRSADQKATPCPLASCPHLRPDRRPTAARRARREKRVKERATSLGDARSYPRPCQTEPADHCKTAQRRAREVRRGGRGQEADPPSLSLALYPAPEAGVWQETEKISFLRAAAALRWGVEIDRQPHCPITLLLVIAVAKPYFRCGWVPTSSDIACDAAIKKECASLVRCTHEHVRWQCAEAVHGGSNSNTVFLSNLILLRTFFDARFDRIRPTRRGAPDTDKISHTRRRNAPSPCTDEPMGRVAGYAEVCSEPAIRTGC